VTQLDGLRRYIEAATTFTSITRAKAEELVRDLVASGELERGRAQDWIDDLLKRSREASETLVSTVTTEVERQLGDLGLKNLDLEELAHRVAGIIQMAGSAGRSATSGRGHRSEPDEGTLKTAKTSKTAKKTSSAKSNSAKSGGKSSASKPKSSSKQDAKGSSSKKTTSSKKESTPTKAGQAGGKAT
jgi:polyhydroxyalkanoate synthesis regulator phasin